jgi:hypothetical protein
MARTPVPPRVNLDELESLIRQRRAADYSTTPVRNDALESLIIEARLFRTHHDAASRRQKDGARAREQIPPKITLETLTATTSHQGHKPPAASPCLHYCDRRRAEVRIVPVDPMHVVVAPRPKPSAVTEWHQNLVRLLAPIGRVPEVAPIAGIGNVMK